MPDGTRMCAVMCARAVRLARGATKQRPAPHVSRGQPPAHTPFESLLARHTSFDLT